jgi:hypothetical protein
MDYRKYRVSAMKTITASAITSTETTAIETQATASLAATERQSSQFIPATHLWVKLRAPITNYSHDEALLLCEEEEGNWVAWVPGYGETLLLRSQFISR